MRPTITIKQLHATTGEHVRRAAKSRSPIIITDRGEPIAMLARPELVSVSRRKRTLLPEFKKMMRRAPGTDSGGDLDAVRGDR